MLRKNNVKKNSEEKALLTMPVVNNAHTQKSVPYRLPLIVILGLVSLWRLTSENKVLNTISIANSNLRQKTSETNADDGWNSEQRAQSRKNANVVQELVCKDAPTDWGRLCSGGFPMAAAQQLLDGEDVNIVQIGAHVGFERNDPIAKRMSRLLDEVTAFVDEGDRNSTRNRFHWTFVEPSPTNFNRLAKNLASNSALCDMKGINAAVVSDSLTNTSNMPFYSLRDTIDPETGYDSLSGKTFPVWITQVSSFSMEPLQFNAKVFKRKGLVLEDYVVETPVVTLPFTKLIQRALHVEEKITTNEKPLLVLIDTEGYDCSIIKGISPSSTVTPKYLIFEHKQCDDLNGASEHLVKKLGYDLYPRSPENIVAVKMSLINSTVE